MVIEQHMPTQACYQTQSAVTHDIYWISQLFPCAAQPPKGKRYAISSEVPRLDMKSKETTCTRYDPAWT